MACVDQLNVPWTDKCDHLKKIFFNERDGKIELPAGIPSEKPKRPVQHVQGEPLCLSHSWSSSPGTRMDEWESVFRINPGNVTSIVLSPPPQGLTWTEIIYQGDHPKTTHQILSPFTPHCHGLTQKPFAIVHSLTSSAWAVPTSRVPLFLCLECSLQEHKMTFNHQLPHEALNEISLPPPLLHKPNLYQGCPIPQTSEFSALQHSNCPFTCLSPHTRLWAAQGWSPISSSLPRLMAWSTVGTCTS